MSNLQKWFLILALWVVILFLGFGFYWLQIRPAKIRKICSEEAGRLAAGVKSNFADMIKVNQAMYSDCLNRNGVER